MAAAVSSTTPSTANPSSTSPSSPPNPVVHTSSLTSPPSASSPSPPSVTLTPATPDSPISPALGPPLAIPSAGPVNSPRSTSGVQSVMQENALSDSQTNLVSAPAASTSTSPPPNHSTSSPLQALSRKLSSRSTSAPKPAETAVAAPTSGPVPQSASTSTAASTSKPPPSTATPARSPASKASPKKKRKRKGLAGLLLSLGCLSAADFEDDESQGKGKGETMAMTQKSEAKPVSKPEVKDIGPSAEVGVAGTPALMDGAQPQAETSEAAAATLVGHTDKEKPSGASPADRPVQPAEELVVAPVETVTPPVDETAGVTSAAVQPPGSGSEILSSTPQRPHATRGESESGPTTTSNEKTETSGGYSNISESDLQDEAVPAADDQGDDYHVEDEYEDEEDRLIAQGGLGIPVDENGHPAPLLPVMDVQHRGRKCLVLDLDETLLHSSFKMLPSADFIVPVEIESQTHNVYVIKRPGVDQFLKEMGLIYEIVVFTASLSKYADPVLDMLDIHRVVRHRLFRESCYNHKGNYVKDLSQLGREMESCIIIDNSPASYIFHPNNAVPVSTWFNDPHDTELTDLSPFLADLATVDDIRGVLDGSL